MYTVARFVQFILGIVVIFILLMSYAECFFVSFHSKSTFLLFHSGSRNVCVVCRCCCIPEKAFGPFPFGKRFCWKNKICLKEKGRVLAAQLCWQIYFCFTSTFFCMLFVPFLYCMYVVVGFEEMNCKAASIVLCFFSFFFLS